MATGTMRAAILDGPGLPFRIASIERPQPGRGQVLVRIKASAVNPLDLKIRAGEAAHARQPLPAILGIDLAGTVEAVGPDVIAFHEGDDVYGMAAGVGGLQGSLAEFSAVDARLLARKPANLTMREAAALPLVFITAWEGLVDRAGIHAAEKVLVHGGAGGVGHIALQIARAFDAKTFATGSAGSMAYIAGLGATAINYREETVEAYVAKYTDGEGFDIVYDTVGGATLDSSFTAVKRFGHVVSALGWGAHSLAPLSFRAASYSGVFTLLPMLTGEGRAHHGEILGNATQLVEVEKVKPRVDPHRFSLSTIEDAYSALNDGPLAGKIVVDVAE